ncbi:MAG: TatD family hydrolase [Pseudomonadota bacterium]|nr:TatD family hydrolase [Pseudomonadota bacterium]
MKNTPEIIDTHCHLDIEAFDPDRDEVLRDARQAGVVAQIIPAIEAGGWQRLLDLCAKHDDLYPALGLHPVFVQQHTQADLDKLAAVIETTRPVAIGEIGLDFAIKALDRDAQQQLFEAQLVIAKKAGLPVIIHARKSHDEVIKLLKKHHISGGSIHAFSGSLQQGMHYHEMGFKLGFGGMLTFERSSKLRRLAHDLPAEALLLETDAPDMTVASHRGERNSPQYLPQVLAALAAARGESIEAVAHYTTHNARAAFNYLSG